MRYTLSVHGVVLSAFNRRRIEEKMSRIAKYLRHPLPVEITFRREGKGLVACGITYGEGKLALHAERSNHTLEESLDKTLDAFKKELIKQHEKQRVQGWVGILHPGV